MITLPLLLAGLWRYLTPSRKGVKPVLLQVPLADIPAGGALVFREERIALLREGGEPVALSLVCTHLGCTVTVTPTEITCPCHGSRFDLSGKVLAGPAERGLERLQLQQEGQMLVVRG